MVLLAVAMSKVQSGVSTQGACCMSSTLELHFCCSPGSTKSKRVRNFTPLPQLALQGLQSLHSVVGHMGSGISSGPVHGKPIHFSFSTEVTWGHFLRPILSIKCLVLIIKPTPHEAEHWDQEPHGVVAQTPSFSLRGSSIESSWSLVSVPLTFSRVSLKSYVFNKYYYPSHSGIDATHISLETSWRLHPNICAF